MLCLLRIKNFALCDRLELEWQSGLTVLTGETGAGKSIILDAIDLALGGKANARMIRRGSDQSIIEATFLMNPTVQNWLIHQEIDPLEEGTLICSRELSLNHGSLRSRCRINGVLVNQKLLAELRDYLVEITAQGQTVELMIPERQRSLLDAYGGKKIQQQLPQVVQAHQDYLIAKRALEKRRKSEQERLQRLDLLQYQLKELTDATIEDPDELFNITNERDRLSHVVDLQQLSYQSNQLLYQNDSDQLAVADLLGKAEDLLQEMIGYDAQLTTVLDMVRNALTEVVEAGHQLSAYGDSLETDPQRLEDIETRIRQLKQICRKYGPTLREAIAYQEKLQNELLELTDGGQSLESLEKDCQIAEKLLQEQCAILTTLRQVAATKLAKQLIKELKPLAMEKVIFECRITPSLATANGADEVTYFFSPNPGEKAQPLALIASGGEMSRFLLALKSCFNEGQNDGKILIFDEIDAGVSGKVAQAIATKLNQLSQQHQVLCVTHQPLIAAMADGHYRVEKQVVLTDDGIHNPEKRTVIRVEILGEHHSRREELAELTGGHAAPNAIAFADSLLLQAQSQKAKN